MKLNLRFSRMLTVLLVVSLLAGALGLAVAQSSPASASMSNMPLDQMAPPHWAGTSNSTYVTVAYKCKEAELVGSQILQGIIPTYEFNGVAVAFSFRSCMDYFLSYLNTTMRGRMNYAIDFYKFQHVDAYMHALDATYVYNVFVYLTAAAHGAYIMVSPTLCEFLGEFTGNWEVGMACGYVGSYWDIAHFG